MISHFTFPPQGIELAQDSELSERDIHTFPRELDIPEVVGVDKSEEDSLPPGGAMVYHAPGEEKE